MILSASYPRLSIDLLMRRESLLEMISGAVEIT
jgi:hypothetical protein